MTPTHRAVPITRFLYSNGAMTDLNSLIDPHSGWTLETATAINDQGQIVGWGTNAVGQTEAFLLSPYSRARQRGTVLASVLSLFWAMPANGGGQPGAMQYFQRPAHRALDILSQLRREVFMVVTGVAETAKDAARIAYEGFNYNAGDALNGLNGGVGFSDAWSVGQGTYAVTSGDLADPTGALLTSGNSLQHAGAQPQAVRHLN